MLMIAIYAAYYIFTGICLVRIFKKAALPGWPGFVPFVRFLFICRAAWGRMRVFWRVFVPILDIVFLIRTYHKLSKAFGHGVPFTLGLIFLGIIFYAALAFGDSAYALPRGGRDREKGEVPA